MWAEAQIHITLDPVVCLMCICNLGYTEVSQQQIYKCIGYLTVRQRSLVHSYMVTRYIKIGKTFWTDHTICPKVLDLF